MHYNNGHDALGNWVDNCEKGFIHRYVCETCKK